MSAIGNQYLANHPEYDKERKRERYAKYGHNPLYDFKLEKTIRFNAKDIIISSDWHIPFQDKKLVEKLYGIQEEYGIEDFACIGDFFDCSNYSPFVKGCFEQTFSFQDELDAVGDELRRLSNVFKNLYFCTGNHEMRWSKLNFGYVGTDKLFRLLDVEPNRYKVTNHDCMVMNKNWLLCHPNNFRQQPLSVARELASKYLMNIVAAHGHYLMHGYDKSGQFVCLDSGGLFDSERLAYLSRTTCHPSVFSGFFYMLDGKLNIVRGKGIGLK